MMCGGSTGTALGPRLKDQDSWNVPANNPANEHRELLGAASMYCEKRCVSPRWQPECIGTATTATSDPLTYQSRDAELRRH